MKKDIKLSPVQQTIFDACQVLIDKAVELEKERVMKMSIGCAEWCTARAQEILAKYPVIDENTCVSLSHNHEFSMSHLLYKYKTYIAKLNYASPLYNTFGRSFEKTHNLSPYGYSNEKGKELISDSNKGDFKILFSQKLFTAAIKEYEYYYRMTIAGKLIDALNKYVTDVFEQVYDIVIERGVKGYEVTCTLIDYVQQPYTMHCRAIDAGGHNIQCFHYRYITKVKSQQKVLA